MKSDENKRSNLTEVKSGNVGYGLLIENDGYISLDCGKNKTIKEGIESGTMECPNPLILDAVFQKYGIKNANGRVYPENILKREVEKYQKLIDEKMALGECYTPTALVLTASGWRPIGAVEEGESIITMNVETDEIELQNVTRKVQYHHVGKMVRIKGDDIDDLVTHDHGFPIYDEEGDFEGFYTANDLLERRIENMDDKFIAKITNEDEESIESLVNEAKNGKLDCDISFISLDKCSVSVTEEDYDGYVMCIEVPNHTFYVSDNGKAHWTKNCNHPAETNIDLGRITHNIIELHWEGSTLVGKIQVNLTPGYCKYGICSSFGDTIANLIMNGFKIGVSSRGVGSVEKRFGELVVGDDFEIVCWDVVATPSTPGAYIGFDKSQLQQYVESTDTKRGKGCVNEKINRVKSILS